MLHTARGVVDARSGASGLDSLHMDSHLLWSHIAKNPPHLDTNTWRSASDPHSYLSLCGLRRWSPSSSSRRQLVSSLGQPGLVQSCAVHLKLFSKKKSQFMLCWFARILFAVKSWWRNGALLTSVRFSLELEMIVTDKSRVCQSAFVWMEVRKWLSIEIWI